VTLFREGSPSWNFFENQATELGQFGGIVSGSVHLRFMSKISKELNENK
jgi:hypothetical protein